MINSWDITTNKTGVLILRIYFIQIMVLVDWYIIFKYFLSTKMFELTINDISIYIYLIFYSGTDPIVIKVWNNYKT